MDFDLSEEHQLLKMTLKSYFSRNYDLQVRNEIAYSAPYASESKWQQIADLGILFAFATEENGGLGGHGNDIALTFEEIGRSLCPEPFLGNLMGIQLLSKTNTEIEPYLSGKMKLACAFYETPGDMDIRSVKTQATAFGNHYLLYGVKRFVYGAEIADEILVSAKLDGKLRVFKIDPNEAQLKTYGLVEGGGAGDLILENTPAEILHDITEDDVADTLERGALALSAETLGVSDAAYELLLDYVKTREQFGASIGSFQAIQHRMVDMMVEIEQLRSAIILAANSMGTPKQNIYVSIAKTIAGRTARYLSREVTQLHGGVGMTWEYPSSHYAKRLAMIDLQLGDTEHHRDKVVKHLREAYN